MKCLACNKTPCDPHHIKTRGAFGGDEEYNIMPICRFHHVEVHQLGLKKFSEKYNGVQLWLHLNKWKFDEFMGKYMHLGKDGWED